jgi:hypothetical protein
MAVKVLMTWDIAGERDQEYFEFIIGEFIPGVQRLGLAARGSVGDHLWVVSADPGGLLASDAAQARRVLDSSDWGCCRISYSIM